MHLLSKSTYIRGRQCTKALWLYKHRRELMAPVEAGTQAIFDTGAVVGELAQQLFPGGVDCTPTHRTTSRQRSRRRKRPLGVVSA